MVMGRHWAVMKWGSQPQYEGSLMHKARELNPLFELDMRDNLPFLCSGWTPVA